MKKFNIILNYFAAIIILISVLVIIIMGCCFMLKNTVSPKSSTLIVKFKIDTPTNQKYNILELSKLDSVSKDIAKKLDEIQFKQDVIVQNESNDNTFNKLFTVIVAFVVAIAGFFGFKSINEIKEQATNEAVRISKEEAKTEATKAAKEEASTSFNKVFTEQYEGEIFNKAMKATNEIIRKELDEIRNDILNIQSKITESASDLIATETDEESQIEDVNDPFDSKNNDI